MAKIQATLGGGNLIRREELIEKANAALGLL
jgi:hypothetical protein